MSYTERRALELLPARIASLEARIEALNGVLADPDLYARDRARFEGTNSALAAAREELTAAEEQWLTLEMRHEGNRGVKLWRLAAEHRQKRSRQDALRPGQRLQNREVVD